MWWHIMKNITAAVTHAKSSEYCFTWDISENQFSQVILTKTQLFLSFLYDNLYNSRVRFLIIVQFVSFDNNWHLVYGSIH